MVVDGVLAIRARELLGPKVVGLLERHVAAGTCFLGFFRVVKAACSMSRNTTEQPRVIVILPPQEILVLIQCERQVYFVTR